MSDKLPNFIDPVYCANNNKQFVASVKQALFPRLEEQAHSEGSLVSLTATFEFNKSVKAPVMKLQLQAELMLTCQRSLQGFRHNVESCSETAFVETMAVTDDFPSDMEVLELDEDKISLYELIEDELLLNIPMVPINDASQMNYKNTDVSKESETLETLTEKTNPFAALKGMKLGD